MKRRKILIIPFLFSLKCKYKLSGSLAAAAGASLTYLQLAVELAFEGKNARSISGAGSHSQDF